MIKNYYTIKISKKQLLLLKKIKKYDKIYKVRKIGGKLYGCAHNCEKKR